MIFYAIGFIVITAVAFTIGHFLGWCERDKEVESLRSQEWQVNPATGETSFRWKTQP